MTLAASTTKISYTGNGVTTVFDFTYPIFEATDLVVTVYDLTGLPSVLVLNTDYTVAGVGEASGSITLTTALTNLFTIVIQRLLPVTQTTDIRNQGSFFPEIHENEFDYLTGIDQQQQEQLNRTMKIGETDTAADLTLPNLAARKGQILGFDATTGDPIAVGIAVNTFMVSAFMQTVLTAANAATARSTLQTPNAAESLTNKTINASLNTISNVTVAMMSSGAATNGQVATANGSGGVTWQTPTAQGLLPSVTVSTSGSITQSHFVYFCDVSGAGLTLTLPVNSSNTDYEVLVKNISIGSAHLATVTAAGSDAIEGGSGGGSITLAQGESIKLKADGAGTWWQVG